MKSRQFAGRIAGAYKSIRMKKTKKRRVMYCPGDHEEKVKVVRFVRGRELATIDPGFGDSDGEFASVCADGKICCSHLNSALARLLAKAEPDALASLYVAGLQ